MGPKMPPPADGSDSAAAAVGEAPVVPRAAKDSQGEDRGADSTDDAPQDGGAGGRAEEVLLHGLDDAGGEVVGHDTGIPEVVHGGLEAPVGGRRIAAELRRREEERGEDNDVPRVVPSGAEGGRAVRRTDSIGSTDGSLPDDRLLRDDGAQHARLRAREQLPALGPRRERGPRAPGPREHGPRERAPHAPGPHAPGPREHGPHAPGPREHGRRVPHGPRERRGPSKGGRPREEPRRVRPRERRGRPHVPEQHEPERRVPEQHEPERRAVRHAAGPPRGDHMPHRQSGRTDW